MKIIIACFLKLDELPPAVTLLKIISQKYKIIYLGIDNETEYYNHLFNNNVKFIKIIPDLDEISRNFSARLKRYLRYKFSNYFFRRTGKLINELYKEGDRKDIVWILHEYTLMHLNNQIEKLPFYLTMYELHPDIFQEKNLLKKRIMRAEKIIVPEYSRAAIVQACIGLKEMPCIIQNKPYEFSEDEIKLSNNPVVKIASKLHQEGKLLLLYSGIFLRERKLDTIIEAVRQLSDIYEMILIGRKSPYLEELLRKYTFIQYLGFFNPPAHLSIVKYTDVGILTYVADSGSINPVFCAPNKIWEYGKYGIPMLCNDIPGLKYTVEYNRFGYCCDINSVYDIKEKLIKIYKNYTELSKNSLEFYNSVNVEKSIMNIIDKIN